MTMPGSRREPNRDFVRRTPLATARTRPRVRVSIVMMRSASPSLWVRRTIASSRYRGMAPFSPAADAWVHRTRRAGRTATERGPPGTARGTPDIEHVFDVLGYAGCMDLTLQGS